MTRSAWSARKGPGRWPTRDFFRGRSLAGAASTAARQRLEDAANLFLSCDMELCAAVMRWQLGKLAGGPEGTSLKDRGAAFMSEQGIQDPARWASMYAPGFSAVEM